MAHIDTLEAYKNYINSGYSEEQAEIAVKVLEKSFDRVATKEDLLSLEKNVNYKFQLFDIKLDKISTDLKVTSGLEIASFFIFMMIGPLILKKLGWIENK